METNKNKYSRKEIMEKVKEFLDECTQSVKKDSSDSYSVAKLLPLLKAYLLETMGLIDRADRTLNDFLAECKRAKLASEKGRFLVLTSKGLDLECGQFFQGDSASRLVRNLEKQGYEVLSEPKTEGLESLEDLVMEDFDEIDFDIADSLFEVVVLRKGSKEEEPAEAAPVEATPIEATPIEGAPIEGTPSFEVISPKGQWLLDMDGKICVLESAISGIDDDIQKLLSSLSYEMINQGSIISLNSLFVDFLNDKRDNFNGFRTNIAIIRSMLEDGSCYEKTGVLPLVQFGSLEDAFDTDDTGLDALGLDNISTDDMELDAVGVFDDSYLDDTYLDDTVPNDLLICFDDEETSEGLGTKKKKIVRNGNPFKRGPRKKPNIPQDECVDSDISLAEQRTTEEIMKLSNCLKEIEEKTKKRKEVELLRYLDIMGKQSDLSEEDDPVRYRKVIECLKELEMLL